MASRSLAQWLRHIDAVHPQDLELGLARVAQVARRLQLLPMPMPTVIVAGTNGKGSTCVATEAVLSAAGLKVGTTLSPHLARFNERVRIAGEPCDDALLCDEFAAIEAVRGDVLLTYFEFSALLALRCFRRAQVDVAVLEVGLGGRLDAFNIVDADVAVITSIGLDHMAYLGDNLEQIGLEKAGVLREEQAVVLGPGLPGSVLRRAHQLRCQIDQVGGSVDLLVEPERWSYESRLGRFGDLPVGPLAPMNCALGLHAALLILASQSRTLADSIVRDAVGRMYLAGRMEPLQARDRTFLLDVAHNEPAARFLAEELTRRRAPRGLTAIIGSLQDKDSAGVVAALAGVVRHWIGVDTIGPRGLTAMELGERLPPAVAYTAADSIAAAVSQAHSATAAGDVILACGSFALVEAVREQLVTEPGS